jgi:hypothetical protein
MAWWFKDLPCELCDSFAFSAVKFFSHNVREEHRQGRKAKKRWR